MSGQSYFQFPNRTPDCQYSTNSTAYQVLATDGTAYTTYADLVAAGKTAWPGLDPGMSVGALSIVTRAADAAGSPFYFSLNNATAPSAGGGEWVPGGSIVVENPGVITRFWFAKSAGTDILVPIYRY